MELDRIIVELEVVAVQSEGIWMQGNTLININGLKPYGESDIINTNALLERLQKDGEYHIFSCCCGLPKCSGWIHKMHISTDKEIVKWIEPNNQKTWYFDKNSILKQIESMKEEVHVFKKYFKEKQIRYVGVGYSW